MDELLAARIKRKSPATQDEYLALAARQSIAAHGLEPEANIRAAATGLAAGLFGDAFDSADEQQRMKWIDMAEREYRKAIGQAFFERAAEPKHCVRCGTDYAVARCPKCDTLN
jgi:hypothetical protein